MSYQTNNHEVATVLYYKNNRYSILDAFGSYAKLTTDQYRSLPEVARQNRVEAFYLKLSSELGIENIGSLVLQGSEDRQLNLNGCPIDDYYRITPTANHGTASTEDGNEMYRAGSAVRLTTEPDDEVRDFDGWYVNDELEHSQKEWSFFATRDLAPEARYSEEVYVEAFADINSKVAILGEANAADRVGANVTIGDTITFTALVNNGYTVSHWQNAAGNTVSHYETCVVTASADADKNKVYLKTAAVQQTRTNHVYVSAEIDSMGGSVRVTARTEQPVCNESGLLIMGYCWLDSLGDSFKFNITIPAGRSSSSMSHSSIGSQVAYIEGIDSMSPVYDNCYHYVYEPS